MMNEKNFDIVKVFVHNRFAATLIEKNNQYILNYNPSYCGSPISLTLPVTAEPYVFNVFPAFFDAFLPEGPKLDYFLKKHMLDKQDFFGQLMQTSGHLVGAVTLECSSISNQRKC